MNTTEKEDIPTEEEIVIKPVKRLTITQLPEPDRPREKLLEQTEKRLSDAELLAILIGSGNKNETAVELSQRIMASANNSLNTLGKFKVNDFIKNFNGIGTAKAISIVAALELGRRRKEEDVEAKDKITNSKDVYNIFHPLLGDLHHEEIWVLYLNNANKVLKKIQVNKGNISSSLVDIRLVVKEALDNFAVGVILCHNHPSNEPKPSYQDDAITYRLKDACKLMDIALLDHVIICDGTHYSYKDQKRL